MSDNYAWLDPWQLSEGGQPFITPRPEQGFAHVRLPDEAPYQPAWQGWPPNAGYDCASVPADIPLELLVSFDGHESALRTSTIPDSCYVQDTATARPMFPEPHQNSIGSGFSIAEADGRADPQNVSSACNAAETAFWTSGTAMLDPVYTQTGTFHDQFQHGQEMGTIGTAGSVTGFQFVSGCRPVGHRGAVSAAPSITQEPSEASDIPGLKCDFRDCRSKKIFKRKYELMRHKGKHLRTKTFDCPAVNCKYRGPKAFYRIDKLKSHMDAAHDEDTMFACPVEGCLSARTPLPRDLLVLHIRNHDQEAKVRSRVYSGALALCDKLRVCPVGECRKKLWLAPLQEHILQHTEGERRASCTKIALAGFDSLSGYVICPAPNCPVRIPDLAAFEDHFIDHVASNPDHLRAWMKDVSPFVYAGFGRMVPWQSWWVSRELACPTCGAVSKKGETTHQLDLLKDPEELRGCREQILKLYPDFGFHPVFDDVMPVVGRSAYRES